ncbi:MAG: endolytic transglycosylase MltG [Lachnoclostridium sp.]|nr:endolytic transglycosylase MltG [Lachnospira sp.]MCM1246853.1 endolytic transglycosylase MltG [Lachnoclostridium sp.]
MDIDMKLRYYLRGLGVGILITTLIMGITSWGRQQTLSDAQIRERALKMGMVDANPVVLSDLQENPTGNENESESGASVGSGAPEVSDKVPENPTQSANPGAAAKPGDSTKPEQSTKPSDATEPAPSASSASPTVSTVTVVIKGGSGSETVSKILAEAGLVPDAKAYDQYLCDNGYSKGLRAGTYEIPEGASEEEIAEMIATKR